MDCYPNRIYQTAALQVLIIMGWLPNLYLTLWDKNAHLCLVQGVSHALGKTNCWICTIVNTSCCVYVDQSGRISTDLEEICKQTKILHEVTRDDFSWSFEEIWNKITSWLPNMQWLKQVFVITIAFVILGIFVCIMFKCLLCCTTKDGYI